MENPQSPNFTDIRWDNLEWPKFMALSVSCNVLVKTLIYPTVVAKTRIQVESSSYSAVDITSSYDLCCWIPVFTFLKFLIGVWTQFGKLNIPGANLFILCAIKVKSGEYQSSWKTLRWIHATEGIRGLYRGIATAMVGFVVPQGAYIFVYEKTRDYFHKQIVLMQYSEKYRDINPTFLANTVGGACAAVVATLMNTPVDVITQRLQLQGASSTVASHHNNGGINAFLVIAKKEGLRGLYRGLGATLCSFVPSSAIWWAVYGSLRSKVYPLVSDKGIVAETAGSIFCGVLSGWASVGLLNPLDVAKTRLQTQEVRPGAPKNIFTMAWKILRTEGVVTIWLKGLTARMTNTAFFSSWTIVMYEIVKKWSYIDSSLIVEQK